MVGSFLYRQEYQNGYTILIISVVPTDHRSFPLQVGGAPQLSCKAVVGSSSEREQMRNVQRDSWWPDLHGLTIAQPEHIDAMMCTFYILGDRIS